MITASLPQEEDQPGAGAIFTEVSFWAPPPPPPPPPLVLLLILQGWLFPLHTCISSALHQWSGYLFCLVGFMLVKNPGEKKKEFISGQLGRRKGRWAGANQPLSRRTPGSCHAAGWLLGTVDKEPGSACPPRFSSYPPWRSMQGSLSSHARFPIRACQYHKTQRSFWKGAEKAWGSLNKSFLCVSEWDRDTVLLGNRGSALYI